MKTKASYPAIILLSLLISACANNSTIDYNTATNFNNFKSYHFKNTKLQSSNSLMATRIEAAINAELEKKNLSKQPAADIIVNYYMESITTESPGSRGAIGIGGGGSNVGIGVSLNLPIGGNKVHQLEQLTIDFLSPSTGELLWRGVNNFKQSAKSPEKNQQRIQKTVESILANYPPKK